MNPNDWLFTVTNELHDRFRQLEHAMCCRVLTRKFVWNSEEHKMNCERIVREAAQITDDIIQKQLLDYLPKHGGKALEEKPKYINNPNKMRIRD